jgi:hypothetical protein
MQRVLKRTAVLLAFALIGMQFVSTSTKPNTVTVSEVHMAGVIEPQVGTILDRSCQDCHSSNTRWPWYGSIAPISWILSRDVSKGRKKLDFSQWEERPHSANERMEICDAVTNGSMPLRAYTVLHGNARLSKKDVDLICDWAAAPASNERPLRASGLPPAAETLTSSKHVSRRNTKGSQ